METFMISIAYALGIGTWLGMEKRSLQDDPGVLQVQHMPLQWLESQFLDRKGVFDALEEAFVHTDLDRRHIYMLVGLRALVIGNEVDGRDMKPFIFLYAYTYRATHRLLTAGTGILIELLDNYSQEARISKLQHSKV